MREYPDQPENLGNFKRKYLEEVIDEVLMDELPDCPTNEWFISSVHFANMRDKLIEEMRRIEQ